YIRGKKDRRGAARASLRNQGHCHGMHGLRSGATPSLPANFLGPGLYVTRPRMYNTKETYETDRSRLCAGKNRARLGRAMGVGSRCGCQRSQQRRGRTKERLMIVPTRTLFEHAYGKYALGAYNINNLEQIMGLFRVNIYSPAPFIIQISKVARSYTDNRMLEAMICADEEPFPEAVFGGLLAHGVER